MKRLQVTDMDGVRRAALDLLDVEVEEGSFLTGLAIEHPFADAAVQAVPLEGGTVGYVDIRIPEEKQLWAEHLQGEIEAAPSVTDILPLFAKGYRMSFLWFVEVYLSVDDLAAALRTAWMGSGGQTVGSDMPDERLVELFTECGQERVMLPGERYALASLPESLTLHKRTTLGWEMSEDGQEVAKTSILAYFGPMDIVAAI